MSFFHAIICQSVEEESLTLSISTTYSEISGQYTRAVDLFGQTFKYYAPRMLYHNGKTFLLFATKTNELPFGQAKITLYDSQAGVDRIYTVGRPLSTSDTHQIPCMAIDDDDAIHVFQENMHDTPLDRYKGGADSDVGFFTKENGASIPLGTELSYAHPLKLDNGNGVIFSRGMAGEYDIYITKSSSGFDTWGAQRKTTEAGSDFHYRHYPSMPFGHGQTSINGKFYLVVGRRWDDAILFGQVIWYQYHLLVTEDFDTFTNYDESYSHNIASDGVISDATLNTYFKFYGHAQDKQGFSPISGITQDGKFYAIQGNATQDGYNFIYWNGSAWATRDIDIPNLAPTPDYSTDADVQSFQYVVALSQNDVRVVVSIVEDSKNIQHWYQTTDEGVTWTDLGYCFPEKSTEANRILLPSNITTIPADTNFGVFFSVVDAAFPTYWKLYGKSASWGTLQAIPGLTITPAVSMSRATGNLFHYKAVDADITRSGNNVTALVDKFGIRNATGVNNPQWNGVDAISTNGTNNYFNLGGIAGLATVQTGTYMGVAKGTGSGPAILSFTDNTGVEVFEIQLSVTTGPIVGSAATLNRNSAGDLVRSYGQDVTNDDQYHLITVVVDGFSKTDIYVDGKLQYQQSTASTATEYAMIGDSQWNYTTVNAARIGSRDNTTDTFVAITFKEIVGWSECLPVDELRQKMKALCDAHGITYQNQFQVPV